MKLFDDYIEGCIKEWVRIYEIINYGNLKDKINLNIGCGETTYPDSINMDMRKTSITDEIYNFELFPWPFKDERFDSVFAFDIIEHLSDVFKTVDEIHRILKPEGNLIIRTNHCETKQSFIDPSHIHFFHLDSFSFYDESTPWGKKYHWYTDKKFKIMNKTKSGEELIFVLKKSVKEFKFDE